MTWAYELRDARFDYGAEPVLRIDELRIARAGITALVGPNGSGKSTLLNHLAFLVWPGRGSLRFHDREIGAADFRQYRRRVGYVQQKPYLFHASVRDNIELGLRIRGIDQAARRERMQKIIREFDLDAIADRQAHGLSGGEAQKVALARALVLQPEVLILDEPFNHLDKTFRLSLEDRLREIVLRDAATVILTTHDQFLAQTLSNQVFSLIDGHLLPLAAMNLFSGRCSGDRFVTGKLEIAIPPHLPAGNRLAIEANQLVLSKEPLESSMRNRFQGRILRLSDEDLWIHVTIDAGEQFHAVITPAALKDLGVSIGDAVWVSFKSTSVHLF
jgi:molybdopterin-binding protein